MDWFLLEFEYSCLPFSPFEKAMYQFVTRL